MQQNKQDIRLRVDLPTSCLQIHTFPSKTLFFCSFLYRVNGIEKDRHSESDRKGGNNERKPEK